MRIAKKEDPFAQGHGVPNSVNFGSVKVGETATRALFLYNDSELPALFQFIVEENGIFGFSRYKGVIPGKLEIHVKLKFSPLKPANYYQRVFMLVENRQPLFVDLLGTSYVPARGEVKEQRPAPLRHAHVQAFRNRMQGWASSRPTSSSPRPSRSTASRTGCPRSRRARRRSSPRSGRSAASRSSGPRSTSR